MQSFKFLLVTVFSIASFIATAQTKNESINVRGNCGMCQNRIEKAAKESGATAATWDAATNNLTVSYNAATTSLAKIETGVAAVGHDTKNKVASKDAYNKLHDCCKYERKQAAGNSASCCTTGAECCTSGKACCTKPVAASFASIKDCCVDGAGCCSAAQACCSKEPKVAGSSIMYCCVQGAACCNTAKDCCTKAGVAVDGSVKTCCTVGASCCIAGATCCAKPAAGKTASTQNCCEPGADCCAKGEESACCSREATKA